MKTKIIKQSINIDTSPHEIFEAFMDSKKHAELVSSTAKISREAGGEFRIYDSYITGKNIEIIPDKKIVQLWRAEEECWPKEHFSTISLDLEAEGAGTKINFTQTNVPEDCYDDIYKGWYDFYWDPLKEMFKK